MTNIGEDVDKLETLCITNGNVTADGDSSHEIKTFAPWKKSYDKPRQHI